MPMPKQKPKPKPNAGGPRNLVKIGSRASKSTTRLVSFPDLAHSRRREDRALPGLGMRQLPGDSQAVGASIIGGHIMWPKGRDESPDTKLGMDDFSLPGPYLLGGVYGSCGPKPEGVGHHDYQDATLCCPGYVRLHLLPSYLPTKRF
jgi:hypothetical protein